MKIGPLVCCVLLALNASSHGQTPSFHSSPECWAEPRVYHSKLLPDLKARFHILTSPASVIPAGEPVLATGSPFRYWVRDVPQGDGGGAGVIVDGHQDEHTVMLFEGITQSPAPQWINSSLIYMRIHWGRMVSSDLVFDAENSQVIYHEAAINGHDAWQQYRAACFARCPCAEPSPARADLFPVSQPSGSDIIGLLDMPGVFSMGEADRTDVTTAPKFATVHSAPMARSRILLEAARPGNLEYREYGYEQGAASVYERLGGWFRVKLSQGGPYGWVAEDDASAHFYPVSDLLQRRLGYLTADWNGQLWDKPPAPAVSKGMVRPSIRHGYEQLTVYPASVTETRQTARGLWLKVQVLRADPCMTSRDSGAHADDDLLEHGWVPAYSGEGKLTSWFYSRGC